MDFWYLYLYISHDLSKFCYFLWKELFSCLSWIHNILHLLENSFFFKRNLCFWTFAHSSVASTKSKQEIQSNIFQFTIFRWMCTIYYNMDTSIDISEMSYLCILIFSKLDFIIDADQAISILIGVLSMFGMVSLVMYAVSKSWLCFYRKIREQCVIVCVEQHQC